MCTTQTMNPVKVQSCLSAADSLLQANNTCTTLEIKNKLINDAATQDFFWPQNEVHVIMDEAYTNGKYKVVDDNGTYRTYAATATPASLLPAQTAAQTASVAPKRGRGRPKGSPNKPKTVMVQQPTATVGSAPTGPVAPTAAPKRASKYSYISRKKALELMQGNCGHFFTATFIEKNGSERKMSCQYLKNQADLALGYVTVKEAIKMKKTPGDCIRRVNLQTLKTLAIAKGNYKIR